MVRPADIEALKQLALIGGLDSPVELASQSFANLLEVSQQTASRRLIELTDAGLVAREMGVRKQRIRILDGGRDALRQEHELYRRLFDRPETLEVVGSVETGLGEGRYYLSRPGYEQQFNQALGWTPYPGTLNLRLDDAEANKLSFLRRNPVYTITGFEAEGRTFGGVLCHPAKIGDIQCASILPNRSHYTNTLEVIAPICLRDILPCEDKDRITVQVGLAAEADGEN